MPRTSSAPRFARRSSGTDAALYIRRLIFEGELRPGERVPQDELAQDLGISRIPIREALIALESGGWVSIELHRGAFVTALDEQAVRDHYELYGLVYGFAAKRALARKAQGLEDELAKLADAFNETDDPEELESLAIDFHAAITGAARSPRINVVLRAMSGLVPGNFFELVPAAIEGERRGLTAIARAMKRRDGDRAATEYQRMMRRQADNVVAVFRERGLLDSGASDGSEGR
ncbi:MAG TPA: GntR family transcriptional regulator [Acidimicrobiales bacterium]|jgi:DNA-binding GntR family transcriptional regulator